jgi:pimeloyl-ACP methyl ester carboxylesterase
VPTLLVSSEHDYTPVAEKNRIASEMPRAELAVIEDARHALPVEKPDAFNATVEAFLEERAKGCCSRRDA